MILADPLALRIAGIGGQGNILAGLIIANAGVVAGKNVVHTQSYGAQVRGGISYCDVLICENEIDYPKADHFDIMYFMHSSPLLVYCSALKNNGVILIDSTFVDSIPHNVLRVTKKIIFKPFTKMAVEKFGTPMVGNMIGLGALARATGIVSKESIVESIKKIVPQRYHKTDIEAIEYGFSIIEKEYKPRTERKTTTVGFE